MVDLQTPGTMQVALRGLCPRCGATGLFGGAISFSATCKTCALDFQAFNVGDGAAAFLILIIGAIVAVGAVTLQLAAEPPFWVHILIWVPFTLALTLAALRFAKAALLGLEYRNQAREGTRAE